MTSMAVLKVMIGRVIPTLAPKILMEAIQSVSVTAVDRGRSTFQLSVNADRPGQYTPDYALFSPELLQANNRIILSVIVQGHTSVLIDGFITNIQTNFDTGPGGGTITITGDDVLCRMDTQEKSKTYPAMPLMAIVAEILAGYVEYGVVPEVIPPTAPDDWEPEEHTRIQNCTDLKMIDYYADLVGYIFRVRPTVAMENSAYFGPPYTLNYASAPLNVNLGPETNVTDTSLSYDSSLPMTVTGMLQDDGVLEEDIPVVAMDAVIPHQLSTENPIQSNSHVNQVYYADPTNGSIYGELQAQMAVLRSTDAVVSGTITVDTLRYGHAIEVPSIVHLRGMGFSFNGSYYVSQIQHDIKFGRYQQTLSVRREGLGSNLSNVIGGAL